VSSIPKEAEPAASVHLRYAFAGSNAGQESGSAQVGVTIRKTQPGTYFCAIQFPPSGYCGLQELADGRRVAIFSIWDKSPNEGQGAKAVATGDGFQATTFGGEGEGCRILGAFDWRVDKTVLFQVFWRREDEGRSAFGTWRVDCWADHSYIGTIRFHAGPGAEKPVSGLLSFVEDFDRRLGTKGMNLERMAVFDQVKWPEQGALTKVTFTKVSTGLDASGVERTDAEAIPEHLEANNVGFLLRTGGGAASPGKPHDTVIWTSTDP